MFVTVGYHGKQDIIVTIEVIAFLQPSPDTLNRVGQCVACHFQIVDNRLGILIQRCDLQHLIPAVQRVLHRRVYILGNIRYRHGQLVKRTAPDQDDKRRCRHCLGYAGHGCDHACRLFWHIDTLSGTAFHPAIGCCAVLQ